ncbi:MAG: hypothetical protein EOP02_17205 [Proteobacteria bacterium]|nr:MAG: hypothetical protein EOP02_17205 [Pseudomonadota bacterium]
MQALWATHIVAAYIRRLLELEKDRDQAIKACRRVAKIAEFKYGSYCFKHFDLDPLDAVPPYIIEAIGEGFASEEWPRTVKRIRAKQDRWREQVTRVQPQIKQSLSGGGHVPT